MNKAAQLPAWIIERYQQLFHSIGLDNKLFTAAMDIIKYTLPPPHRPDLQLAGELFSRDHETPIPTELTEVFANLEALESTPCTTAGTQYPLWYAISQSKFLNRQEEGALTARQFLIEWFTPVMRGAEPGIYRTQVLHVRHILVLALENTDLHGISLSNYHSIIRIMGHPSMRNVRNDFGREYQTFYELYEAQRRPGVRIGLNLSGYKRARNHSQRPRQLNRYQVSRREQIADAPLAPQHRITDTTAVDGALGMDHLDTELTGRGYRYERETTSPRTIADDAEPKTPVIERSTPSQLTPADDRRAARQAVQMAATNTLATQEDVHRLTPWQIRQVLSHEMPPLEWALIRLLLVTGMPVNRLVKLERSPHDEESIEESTVDTPQWHPESATWRYRLRDGPSPAQDGGTSHLWVSLRLPTAVNDALLSAGSDTPLAGIIARLNGRLRRMFHDAPGITPTAQRLGATAWLIMRCLAADNHEVLTLRGEYGLLEAAPAAYRQIDSASLQQLFDAGMNRCGIPTPSSAPPPTTCEHVGSSRALPAPAWQQWTTILRVAIEQASEPLEQWLRPDPLPTELVVDYVQLASAYAYLGWLLATGARPVSANTKTIITGSRTWISDKSSRRGKESRVIPLHDVIARQLQSHRVLLEQTINLLMRHHYPIEDQRRADQQWPAWISLTHHKEPRCRIRSLLHADFRQVLSRLANREPTADVLLPADNATRHSTTTALYRAIPEAELDAHAGHARIGRDRSHPRSNAPIHQSTECLQNITAWLKAAGYRELNMETPPWQ